METETIASETENEDALCSQFETSLLSLVYSSKDAEVVLRVQTNTNWLRRIT